MTQAELAKIKWSDYERTMPIPDRKYVKKKRRTACRVNHEAPPLAYTQGAAVYHQYRDDYFTSLENGSDQVSERNMFSVPDIDWSQVEHQIMLEGFYFYGGKSEKGAQAFISD